MIPIDKMEYRLPKEKGPSFASYDRQKKRYEIIRPYLGTNSIGCEIGVYRGGFAEFLRVHCKKLYLVDPWFNRFPFWGDPTPENSTITAFMTLLELYRPEIEKGKMAIYPDRSTNFLRNLPDEHLDWVYLDASHTYQETAAELKLCQRKIKRGGFIIGDDYTDDPNSKQAGVKKGVDEFCALNRIELPSVTSRQWVLKNPGPSETRN